VTAVRADDWFVLVVSNERRLDQAALDRRDLLDTNLPIMVSPCSSPVPVQAPS